MNGQNKEGERQKNRAEHPLTAALLDEFRQHFGEGVTLLYSDLDGKPIGRKPVKCRGVTAEEWLETSAKIERNREIDERYGRKRQ